MHMAYELSLYYWIQFSFRALNPEYLPRIPLTIQIIKL